MDDEVTFDDWFNSLSIAQAWALLVSVATVLSALAAAGFWFGQKLSENQGAVQITSLQTRVQLLESSNASLISANDEWRQAYKNLENQMTNRNAQVSQLSNQLSQQSNCNFIQNQIRSNKDRMNVIDTAFSYSGEGAYTQRLRQERAELNQEIARYQEQLGRCG